ncbi:MAG: zinc ribbon domain-containing protein [Candidatus Cloacimonetes bacterium]|nr:zinc ribbon domain-containing protein [Candidatus Cloacimonadota bacterium]
MKICKKCKTGNEETSRFCYQCGVKLQSGFPKLALPKSKGLKKGPATFNPSQFIAHPMQDESRILSSQNQGSILSPDLQKVEQNRVVDKKQVLKEIQDKLPKSPSTLKASAPKLNLPELKIPAKVLESKEKLRPQKSRASILNPDQKLLLQKQLPTFKGVKPQQATFDMIKVEKMKAQELERQIKAKRQKQIEKDLAYLDQLFPKDKTIEHTKSAVKKIAIQPKEVIEEKVEEVVVETKKPVEQVEAVEKASPSFKPTKIAINRKEASENTVLSQQKSNQWVSSLKSSKQKSPSDELKKYHTGDSSELITPLLTFASFIYFFYVLYI